MIYFFAFVCLLCFLLGLFVQFGRTLGASYRSANETIRELKELSVHLMHHLERAGRRCDQLTEVIVEQAKEPDDDEGRALLVRLVAAQEALLRANQETLGLLRLRMTEDDDDAAAVASGGQGGAYHREEPTT